MMTKQTLLVVGAGASAEVGLPTGNQLKATIAGLLSFDTRMGGRSGDDHIRHALSESAQRDGDMNQFGKYLSAAKMISDAMNLAKSIDHYIYSHQGHKFIERAGKLAIAKAILDAERESDIFVDDRNLCNAIDLDKLKDTWYVKFARLILSCRLSELEEQLTYVKFIIFNYDRCVEQFLVWAIRIYHGISEERAAEFVNKIEMFHPYGTVGRLPWQTKGDAPQVGFGASSYNLKAVSEQVKTFTEGTDPKASEILALRAAVSAADRVLFLGFGFHQLNMDLLTPDDAALRDFPDRVYYGTASGLQMPNQEVAKRRIRELGGRGPYHSINLLPVYCGALIDEFFYEFDS